MSIISSLFKLLKTIFKKILNVIKKIFKKLWPLLLIIAAIYFAPVIAAYLTSVGAPSFLVTAFEMLGTLTPTLTSAISWVAEGASSLGGSVWAAYSSLGLGTQVAIAAGVAAAVAPEETAELITEVGETVGNAVANVAGAVSKGILSSPVGLAAAAVGAFWLFGRDDDKQPVLIQQGAPS